MTAFFVQNVSIETTDTIKVTLRQVYNSERMKRKIHVKKIVLTFTRVGKSKWCCFICKPKNTDLVTVPAKPTRTLFRSMVFLYRWASFVANTTFLIVWIHYIILLVVSLIKIWPLTCSHDYWYVARDISINKSKTYMLDNTCIRYICTMLNTYFIET